MSYVTLTVSENNVMAYWGKHTSQQMNQLHRYKDVEDTRHHSDGLQQLFPKTGPHGK